MDEADKFGSVEQNLLVMEVQRLWLTLDPQKTLL